MSILREHAAPPVPTSWAALAGVTATVSVFAIAQGLSYPLFTLLMQKQGMSPAAIGLSAAMTPLGIMVSAFLIPAATRLVGARQLAIGCAILAAILFVLVGWLQNAFAWYVLRFLIGVAIDPLYVLSEVWMISLAPPARRGRVMGVYTAIVGAGFAAGPLCLALAGSDGWTPFAIGAAAFLSCALCLASVASRLPAMADGHGAASIGSFVHTAPTLLLAVAVAAGFEQAMLSLLPVYGVAYGIGERLVAALLTVLVAGNIALQVPLGFMAERWRPRAVLVGCAFVSVLGAASLPVLIETPLIWPVLFVAGATSYGIYTMALIELGERFSGAALVAGNAAFSVMWGMGGIVGPPGAGGAMQAIGVQGLPLVLCLMCLSLIAFAAYRSRRRS